MNYIKYNCYTLAMISTDLNEILKEFNENYYNYYDLIKKLDTSIIDDYNLNKLIQNSEQSLAQYKIDLQNIHKTLDSIIDIYYVCNNSTLKTNEEISKISEIILNTNSKNNDNYEVEDWLDDFI